MKFLLVTYNDSDGVGQTVVNLNTSINNIMASICRVDLQERQ